jgi:phosphatidylethanolamine/phosphatidyl-N-methylethanolamine N-methyltransferase
MSSLGDTQAHESKLYYEFSRFYDRMFTRVFYPRIGMVVRSLNIEPSAEVLEVGAGTGLAFQAYPSHCHVTGVDLAPDMLELAHEKISWNAGVTST